MPQDNSLTKTLSELGLGSSQDVGDVAISGICVDSRNTKVGDLFAAMPGATVHGGEFIQYAVRMGAAAVLTDSEGLEIAKSDMGDLMIPFIVADDPRLVLSKAAARFYGVQPATMTAVTGTNGKTSVANFIRQIWELLGKEAVNFGTAGVEGAYTQSLNHTTPEPITLHRLLAKLKNSGITHAAMEASSHGLEQRRLDGVYLTVGGFTNFTQDHLDYHKTFEEYFAAKAGLFSRVLPPEGSAVINTLDPKGAELVEIAQSRGQDVITIGHDDADIQILNTRCDGTGQDVRFSWRGDIHTVRLSLIGAFQAENVLLAAGMVIAAGAQPAEVFGTLPNLQTVSGRMQLAATRNNGANVFVDYAHTPDALETALKALRPHVLGRIIVVFGAGGDRDKGKRPLMGKAALDHADVLYVTDDNPRSEEPEDIRADIMVTCPNAHEIGDRAAAILAGVDALQTGDALLIAGKGHETGQTIKDRILPFNDVEQASMSVSALDGMGA
ncbi:UDP-N-acetylmuramoyl-L-alanyl-D-glutamate--2,6-diaminopimelate ligase [Amylibacter sp. SFDW26]|uniref:UDP-N-acetylmuramoyl-L-alanyl-D-glutamate--2, 6-diaminopimelate ligase n=1 Tax=Amylibacter sp. SFDW26 TaxID=2652722 RepID=UPI0012624DDC|nr:UDP-N-acetylmuramoyl-L-alanyl-D-glutamate--2,6-diaminopimelate ligase [Amylibacter sp. SFDW26]KAB7610339.1 UDP-N-acetylmuramoyl-L-alanyl-D-glutamate--2,6-diaminopimelate ligase [Amylibacter sp. SFDW26]